MKTKILNIIGAVCIVCGLAACSSDDAESLNLSGNCDVEAFALDGIQGVVSHSSRTIVVNVPQVYDTSAMTVTQLSISAGASCDLAVGDIMDMGAAHVVRVSNGNVFLDWELTVRHEKVAIKPAAVFVGSASTMDDLDLEAKTACQWMLDNVAGACYASFEDIKDGTCDLTDCKVLWWHWHVNGGVDGHDRFVEKAQEPLAIKNQLQAYYQAGGNMLLTRYAVHLPSFIGATGNDEWTTPNNCWGGNENDAELCNAPWSFKMYAGQEGHALYQGLVAGEKADEVYCTDKGYHITNSTAQYHIGGDWGGYDNHAAWETRTGGTILGVGGDGAIVAWEYPASDSKGGIICIGSGCFDWYSYKYEAGYTENFHKNIAIMTKNAIDYLTK